MKELMIDYRDEQEKICRKSIDDMEFCVHDGEAYFISAGVKHHVALEHVIQMYTN